MVYTLPELGYDYDSLEPYIDAKTMKIHHDGHHAAYVKKLNDALAGHEELQDKPVEELIRNLNSVSEEIRNAVRNNGGGHLNHSMFWLMLKKNVKLSGEIANAIKKDFGNYDSFREQFKKAALGQFGSGWAWLVFNPAAKKLEIIPTANQDNPLTTGKVPILGIDVWEHAYYLKYQNKRDEYIDNFFNVINWKQVEKNLLRAR
ncbi:MAG: superoxide dismutase [Candidatus Pacearchaeota archaeon]|nr:superoxide dismutase [Candidatus Pacearchaeota archaeon]MDE1848847.1 superoxide dismutase [Nanoarchaeota archaeon]